MSNKKAEIDMRLETGVWINKAALYEIMALGFRCPTRELVDALVSGEYAEALIEIVALNDSVAHSDPQIKSRDSRTAILSSYTGQDPADLFHLLRIEYTRLFVGAPSPVISPYAGVWYAHKVGFEPLLFVNKESMAVERIYRSICVDQPEGTNEPLDHIATELEFLQYLCLLYAGACETPPGIEVPDDLYQSFYCEHFTTWAGMFAQKVVEHSRVPFFAEIAKVLLSMTI